MDLERTRISVIDDHPALRRGLLEILQEDPRFQVVAQGRTADEARNIGLDGSTDVLIVDLNMPGDVFGAMKDVTTKKDGARVVVFTAHATADLAIKALDSGAHAFVLKDTDPQDLYDAIETAMRGEVYVTPHFSSQVIAGLRNRDGSLQHAFASLSKRERELVSLLQQGKTNKEIADKLDLTEKTVKHYMTNLMAKLHVRSRVEVVVASQKLDPTL